VSDHIVLRAVAGAPERAPAAFRSDPLPGEQGDQDRRHDGEVVDDAVHELERVDQESDRDEEDGDEERVRDECELLLDGPALYRFVDGQASQKGTDDPREVDEPREHARHRHEAEDEHELRIFLPSPARACTT
jgi:hypothetical protein